MLKKFFLTMTVLAFASPALAQQGSGGATGSFDIDTQSLSGSAGGGSSTGSGGVSGTVTPGSGVSGTAGGGTAEHGGGTSL